MDPKSADWIPMSDLRTDQQLPTDNCGTFTSTAHPVPAKKNTTMLAAKNEEQRVEIVSLREEIVKLRASLTELQRNFSELSRTLNLLRAITSYDGNFIWKVTEVDRSVELLRTGRVLSLQSIPFYTSRFGYKMCLEMCIDGSGTGQSLSLFINLVSGEFDALLKWPFHQRATLVLLDQEEKEGNITQIICPKFSYDEIKPKQGSDISFGCQDFVPLWVLDDPRYVKDDTMFIQVIVDKTGLLDARQ